MRTTSTLVLAATLLAAACSGGPEPPPFRPVADNKLLMQAIVDPAADVIWDSVGFIITAAGEEEIQPQNDEDWTKVRNAAVTIIESGNLMMMVPRAKDGDEWMRVSQGMVDTGTEAMRAAEAKDKAKLFTVGGDIYNVCTNCHSKYSPEVTGVRP